ncbi:MAG: leucine-rich repeat domain-containing protein [Ruminococcus sp.]|nr:leucine-rich repeat domain-containing protein [Ruminococcus sp.]
MKKIISLLLAGIMLLSVMTIGCVGVSAAQTHTSGDYNYQFVEDSETVKITAYTGKNTDLEIPSTLDGYEVSEIGNGAFYINKTLEYVTLPDTIKKIGSDAFKLTDIVEITFNDNLTHIGSLAFYNCTKLKKSKTS